MRNSTESITNQVTIRRRTLDEMLREHRVFGLSIEEQDELYMALGAKQILDWFCGEQRAAELVAKLDRKDLKEKPHLDLQITGQPECAECGGACCQPERLEFPVEDGARFIVRCLGGGWTLEELGMPESMVLGIRINEHGRTVVRTRCFRRGHCDEDTRPLRCLRFPLNYLADDHSDAERAEVAEFCPLLRRLIA